jgi:hypothetical protein
MAHVKMKVQFLSCSCLASSWNRLLPCHSKMCADKQHTKQQQQHVIACFSSKNISHLGTDTYLVIYKQKHKNHRKKRRCLQIAANILKTAKLACFCKGSCKRGSAFEIILLYKFVHILSASGRVPVLGEIGHLYIFLMIVAYICMSYTLVCISTLSTAYQ